MLRNNAAGHLTVYVAKKDLEEEVTERIYRDGACILTLTNGWQLSVPGLGDPVAVPQTVRANRID